MINYLTTKDFAKYYGTENKSLKALLDFRRNGVDKCFNPDCTGLIDKYYELRKDKPAFICRRCIRSIHPMVGTFLEGSHLKLDEIFQIIFTMLYSRNGVAANEIRRMYGYSSRTVFKLYKKIREAMGQCLDFELCNSAVEIDESYISTGTKGMGRKHQFRKGRGSEKHTSILAIVERKGAVKLIVIPSTNAESIIGRIRETVNTSSLIYTDSWPAYESLKKFGYNHSTVNHSIEFVNGSASTNTAENIFSNFKRLNIGTHRNISERFLQGYLYESAFRHTYRFEPDYGFATLLQRLPPLGDHYRKLFN